MHPLIRKLAKPSKVASTFDWKRTQGSTVLSMNIHQDRVGIAIAFHPKTGAPCIELDPLKFSKTEDNNQTNAVRIDQSCLERFSLIVQEHNVCAVVVNWPIQRDTARMGKACGRTIFALEQLWEKSQEGRTGILARPFCLWDASHIVPKQRNDPAKRVDEFGRCASYGTSRTDDGENTTSESDGIASTSDAQPDYFASQERYHEDELTMVCEVWNDFCKEHWPELSATSFSGPDERKTSRGLTASASQPWKKVTTEKPAVETTDSGAALASYGT